MTTGEFASVPVEFIWVNRETRQRKALTNIEELAASIATNGLIHPPVVRRDGQLIVGERRWTAIKSLGWTHMPVQWIEDLDEIELQAVEYEENVRRLGIPWQEECLAVNNYHALRVEQNPGWTQGQTAEALGISDSGVGDRLNIAVQIGKGNKLVSEAPKYSTAKSVTERENQRAKASVLHTITQSVAPEVARAEKVPPLLHTDFLQWSAAYTERPFNFIHCDFPYGVGMDNSDQGGGSAFGTYADNPDVYWHLLEGLAAAMSNVVADSAHLMFWFSMDYYDETKKRLETMGWKISPFPLVWWKSDNTGIIPDAKRGPRRVYETCFIGTRGDRFIHTPVSNAIGYPGRDKTIHMNEKPVGMLKHFMRMFVDGYSTVLDPTCGSANALKAATSLGAPTVLGLERDETFFNLAKGAYFNDDISDPTI